MISKEALGQKFTRRRVRKERPRKPCRRRLMFESLEDRLLLTGVPGFSKMFASDMIGPGSVSTLTFQIDNSDHAGTVTDLSFTDTLPAGVTIAPVPNAKTQNLQGGVITATAGGSMIAFSGGGIGASKIGTISVDVTSSTPGTHMNVSGDLTSSLGNSGVASDDLTVSTGLPGFTIDFGPDPVQLGQRTTLTYTIDNSANASPLSTIVFSDIFPTGMIIAGPANFTTDIGTAPDQPTITAAPGSGQLAVEYLGAFPAVAAGGVATLSVDVVANAVGTLGNTTGELITNAGSSGKAAATLVVTPPGKIHAVGNFRNDPTVPGGTVDFEVTITNFDRNDAATAIAYSIDLDDVIPGITSVILPTDPCGAGSTASFDAMTGVYSVTGGSLGPGESCTFTATFGIPTGTVGGEKAFPTDSLTATIGGIGEMADPVTDSLFVVAAPVLALDITPAVVASGGTATLGFTVTNTDASNPASDVAFTLNLTEFLAGVVPGDITLPSMGELGGAVFATSGNGVSTDLFLDVSGGNVAAGGMESFDVLVDLPAGTGSGAFPATTSPITATIDGETRTGAPGTDDLIVVGAPQFSIEFIDDPIRPTETATLRFELSHPVEGDGIGPASGIGFTLDLSGVAGVTATGLPQMALGGTVSSSMGGTLITFSGGTLMPDESGFFDVSIATTSSTPLGAHTFTTSTISAMVDGLAVTGLATSDDLRVTDLLFTKQFINDPLVSGEPATLRYTLTNDSTTDTLTDIFFTDDLDAELAGLAAMDGLSEPFAGGTLITSMGGTFVTFFGGTLAPGASDTIDLILDVPAGADPGDYLSVTSAISYTLNGMGSSIFDSPATDVLSVDEPVTIQKKFLGGPVAAGGTTQIQYTITNNSTRATMTDIAFMDDLGAALMGLERTGTAQMNVCGMGSMVTGTSVVQFTGGTLAPGASCVFTVDVQVPVGAADSGYPGPTTPVTGTLPSADPTAVSSEAGATATLVVSSQPDFGDAPNTYLTSLAFDGPRHLAPGPRLGALRDSEFNAQTPLNGTGDDVNGADDEDAVASFAPLLVTSSTYSVNLTVANTTGGDANLVGWIDFDRNGSFELDEAATAVVANGATTATLNWTGIGSMGGPNILLGPTYSRFRFTTDTIDGNDPGGAASDGEVEDHALTIESLVVTNTNDGGTGSLRRALQIANAVAGLDTITFNIPGGGPHIIQPVTALPTITDAVIIDGTSEPDFAGAPVVVINGSLSTNVNGLSITSGGSTIKGLAINDFDRNGIEITGSSGNTIQGNFIGTNHLGTTAVANGFNGVRLSNSSNNTIGGTTAAARNVISGNAEHGVFIAGVAATGNVVQGNLIGLKQNGSEDLGNTLSGVVISAGTANTIGGTATGAGNVISGNDQYGVVIQGTTASGNVLRGNTIGLSQDGTADVGNSRNGVQISNSPSTTIGGATASAGNLISGNDQHGVFINGNSATGTLVQGNRIGTDTTGGIDRGNTFSGVRISLAANSTIGGTAMGAGNVISGNNKHGVFISGGASTGTLVQGNLIGVKQNGAEDLGNTLSGVVLSAAGSNTVGGTAAGAGNVISGNDRYGVVIQGTTATNNVLQGNIIGLSQDGTTDVGNTRNGVQISNSPANTIGGTAMSARNVISGNDQHGVFISGANATGTLVQGNLIGTNGAGTADRGNTFSGVRIASASSNTIGGTAGGAGNVIAFNKLDGVHITGASVDNAVQRNSIFSNTDLGIDLETNGVTANDPQDPDVGANNLQNFPVLTSAASGGGSTTVIGTLNSTPNSSFTVEFFSSVTGDPSGNGEGQTFRHSATVNTDGSGIGAFNVMFAAVPIGHVVTATATDTSGNTSEFSNAVAVASGGALLAAGGESREPLGRRGTSGESQELEQIRLQPIVDAALARFTAIGVSDADLAALSSVSFAIADLPGALLGIASGNTITLDVNAAGYGWYHDATPLDDSEFLDPSSGQKSKIKYQDSIDLLTVVLHELQHTLGDGHADAFEALMNETLPAGVRRLPSAESLDALFGNSEAVDELVGLRTF